MMSILNGRVLTINFESDLIAINDSYLIELKLIDKESLKQDYDISVRGIGVIITTRWRK